MKKIIQSYIKFKSKFKPKNDFQFENANYNRLSLINRAINNFDHKTCKYLEIGLGDCNNYNSVSLDLKNNLCFMKCNRIEDKSVYGLIIDTPIIFHCIQIINDVPFYESF